MFKVVFWGCLPGAILLAGIVSALLNTRLSNKVIIFVCSGFVLTLIFSYLFVVFIE